MTSFCCMEMLCFIYNLRRSLPSHHRLRDAAVRGSLDLVVPVGGDARLGEGTCRRDTVARSSTRRTGEGVAALFDSSHLDSGEEAGRTKAVNTVAGRMAAVAGGRSLDCGSRSRARQGESAKWARRILRIVGAKSNNHGRGRSRMAPRTRLDGWNDRSYQMRRWVCFVGEERCSCCESGPDPRDRSWAFHGLRLRGRSHQENEKLIRRAGCGCGPL